MTKADSSKPPAKLETITLKVYIHCEGCRRKVRRIIRVLDGVETVTVDSATGKVTVTGTAVESKAIVQRLQKYGKHAEMWPSSNPGGNNNASGKAGGNNQQGKPKTGTDSGEANKKKNDTPPADAGGDKPAADGAGSEGKKGGGKEEDGAHVAKGGGDASKSNSPEKSKEAPGINKGSAKVLGGGDGGGNNSNGGGGNNGGSGGGGGGGGVEDPVIGSGSPNINVVHTANKSHAPISNDLVQTEYAYHSAEYATHMFSDENANNCSIM